MTQHNHSLMIKTPPGTEAITITHIEGCESLSAPFLYRAKILCEKNISSLLKKNVLCMIKKNNQIIHGVVTQITSCLEKETSETLDCHASKKSLLSITKYLTIEPWFTLLDLEKHSRVFQQKSVIDIFSQMCKENNFFDFNTSALQETYTPLKYVIQYEETNFHFLSRILEEHKIFYSFEHELHRHVMHLFDNPRACQKLSKKIIYSRNHHQPENIFKWEHHTKAHIKTWQANHIIAHSNITNLKPGMFVQAEHPDQSGLYFIIDVEHSASDNTDYLHNLKTSDEVSDVIERRQLLPTWQSRENRERISCGTRNPLFSETLDCYAINNAGLPRRYAPRNDDILTPQNNHMSESYENKFILIPASHPFTPIIKTQKPRMSGSFKATVTGPDGQNIFVNDKGEIKIQFPWDRENKYNEYSSCWIPVAQQSGSQFYPRVGDEVSVRFLYGDPNRPIVMGSIPNKKRPLLYSPTDKINAIKTHSGHEIKFDDHSLTLKSSGDFNMLVNHHFKNTVHGNKTSTINGDQLLEALQGELNVNAHDIELRVGNNAIIMNNQGLSIQAEKIVLSIGGTLLPVARIGDNHQCPQKCGDSPHIGGPILSGSSNVLIDGAPIASVGDTLHCEGATDTIISGIASVTVNGKPIATVNSTCDHGGKITTGDSCVLAG